MKIDINCEIYKTANKEGTVFPCKCAKHRPAYMRNLKFIMAWEKSNTRKKK